MTNGTYAHCEVITPLQLKPQLLLPLRTGSDKQMNLLRACISSFPALSSSAFLQQQHHSCLHRIAQVTFHVKEDVEDAFIYH